ncbi:MAG TPA: hypothetical protein PKU80_10795 [Candidatus Limiplasma sp.]|mgnify:CR=1 FL=1|nr:hypothetical protein [Candidatus Limiplasma sp.]
MKAVVTKISGNRAVLLRQDGTFAHIQNRGYRVGQQINTGRTRSPLLKPLLALAGVVLVLFSATALATNFLPFSYISVDVNPSLTMTLNWFNRVLAVEAVNADAEEIAERLTEGGVIGQPVDEAVQTLYAILEQEQYFTAGSENNVVVSVASYGIKDVSLIRYQLEAMQEVENSGTELAVRVVLADRAMVIQAEELGTTAGKLAMVKPLAGDSPEEVQAWLRKSVREILMAGQGNEEAAEFSLTIETEAPVQTTKPPQEPVGHQGSSPSLSPQPEATAGEQNAWQSGPSQTSPHTPMQSATAAPTPKPTPKPTQRPTAAPTQTPQPTSTPMPTPQADTGGQPATGGGGQTQPATASPGGGQGKGK